MTALIVAVAWLTAGTALALWLGPRLKAAGTATCPCGTCLDQPARNTL